MPRIPYIQSLIQSFICKHTQALTVDEILLCNTLYTHTGKVNQNDTHSLDAITDHVTTIEYMFSNERQQEGHGIIMEDTIELIKRTTEEEYCF